ncbi:MAG: HIT family protein [Hyphomicrobiales bacterium]
MNALKTGFSLSDKLEADTFSVLDLRLSTVRLMNDARYPWIIMVPRIAHIEEMYELSRVEQSFLMEEMSAVSRAVKAVTNPTKMNVGALGNIVRQLHIHVIARFDTDATWPDPVWGKGEAKPYNDDGAAFLSLLRPQITQEMDRK